jgi:predicted nuclease of predicted toxin-antitoxin system
VILWLDAQLSPALADWIRSAFEVDCAAVRDHGLQNADDHTIFMAARAAGAVVATKDVDFVRLLDRYGPPPQLIWITCGNTSNASLKTALQANWQTVRTMLDAGERLVELTGER